MSELEPDSMSPDQQEAQSIRYGTLIAVALLSSGKWAVYTTNRIDRDSFRNNIEFFYSFPAEVISARCEAERVQRVIEDQDYEDRRDELSNTVRAPIVAKQTLEDMGL